MVYLTTEYCVECETTLQMCNGKCPKCEERKRRVDIAAWQALSTDEKLLDLHKRILELEKPEPRY